MLLCSSETALTNLPGLLLSRTAAVYVDDVPRKWMLCLIADVLDFLSSYQLYLCSIA